MNFHTRVKKDHTPHCDARTATAWASAPAGVRASDDLVDFWRLPLRWPPEEVGRFRRTLSADEAERAARFHFDRDRDRFTAARALLRAVLALYLGSEPASLRFTYGPRGKPALAGDAADEGDGAALRFNLAHSHELALLAVARGREVGVDLERVRAGFATAKVAERFFSPREAAALRALPEGRPRVEAFYRCWTRKEAFIKATGEGFSFPLSAFTVSVAPGEPAALLACDTDDRETRRWTLVDLEPGAGYLAAAAVEGRGWRARTFEAGVHLFGRQ